MKTLSQQSSVLRACTVCTLLLIGALAGSWLAGADARAEVREDARKNDSRAAFLSGGERSEKVLREISQTLKVIDGRLARLEKMAVDAQR